MKTIFICAGLSIALLLLVMQVSGANNGDINLRAFYETYINNKIDSCDAKAQLCYSKSKKLRAGALQSMYKAAFLRKYQNQLIKEMLGLSIGNRAYKIDYFLNQRFFQAINLRPHNESIAPSQ